MKTITSRHHLMVGAFRELAETPDPAGRRLLLDGAHLVRDAHAAHLDFEVAAVADSRLATGTEEGTLAQALQADGIEVFSVSDHVFSAISPVRTPSGIVAVARREPAALQEICQRPDGFLLVAVDVQDPGNLGSLVRAAEAGGVTGVIVCGVSANPFAWKALRGSMGSALRLPIATGVSLDSVLACLEGFGARAVASVPRDGAPPDEVDWRGRVALLLGGEGHGLDPAIAARCNARVTIPMTPPVESLNIAAAGAILVYAARRQRHAGQTL